jgi:hypothetical protein
MLGRVLIYPPPPPLFPSPAQKFGAEDILKLIPETDKALVQHISKMMARSKKKLKEKLQSAETRRDVDMATEEDGARGAKSFAEFMEMEGGGGGRDVGGAANKDKEKAKGKNKKSEGKRIREAASGEVLNLLDSNKMVAQILREQDSDDDDSDDGVCVCVCTACLRACLP